ncbi:MAG: hypothetical protein ACO1OY_06545 [Ramlibacter sp.]
MRRWLLLVMVLLLPLRAWVGDAMAGQMLQQAMPPAAHAMAQPATAPAAPHHAHAGPTLHHDCDEAPAATGQPDPGDDAAMGDCPTCASCQACSAVALSPAHSALPLPSFPHAPPHGGTGAHASAEQPHAFKPPRG